MKYEYYIGLPLSETPSIWRVSGDKSEITTDGNSDSWTASFTSGNFIRENYRCDKLTKKEARRWFPNITIL